MAEQLPTWPASPSYMSGDGIDNHPTDTESQPEDTFALVGHEVRAGIIQVLGRDELSLSELRSRLNMDVEPSQLHYHLEQLVGHFVEKTDKGYRLNSVGIRLSRTLQAGRLDRREEQVTVDANFECYYCQGRVEAIFNKGTARIVCPECEHLYVRHDSPFSFDQFEDETEAFLHYGQYLILKMIFLSHNVCASCAYPLRPTLRSTERDDIQKVVIDKTCELCGASWVQVVGVSLLADSELRSFCLDHGVDPLSTPHWELEFAATDEHVTVRSTDPWEVALVVTFDGDTLELVINGDLNVVERNRLDATTDTSAWLLDDIQNDATFRDIRQRRDEVVLPDEAACLQSIRRHRWPEAITCPRCDSADTTKEGWTSKGAQRYRCHDCDSTFNDLTETFFAEHRLSLPEMFYIIWEMDETATAGIARHLDRSSQSVLNFIREVEDARDGDSERHR